MNSFDELLKQLLPQQKPVYQPSAVNQLTAPKPQAEVTAYEPTLRQRGQQAVQGLLENIGYDRGYSRGVSQSLLGGPSSTLPMDMGLADVVPGLGYLLGAEESMQGVKSAKKNLDEGNIGSAALEYGLSSLGLLPGIAGMHAYHGSPHDIKGKFDLNKVGTGEGAQAYGSGMYFGQARGTGEAYRRMLVENPTFLETKTGKIIDQKSPEYTDIIERRDRMQRNGYGDDFEKKYKTQEGYLYKVDIPDEQIPKMLDWDKPLSQQNSEVQKVLSKYDPDLYNPEGNDYDPNELGQMIYNRIAGKENIKNPSPSSGNRKASEKLLSLGIPGIRYLDEGSRSGTKKGTSNFVVFKPETVKILEKNDMPYQQAGLLNDTIDAPLSAPNLEGGLLGVEALPTNDYKGSHVAPNANSYGATLDDLTKIMPANVYTREGKNLYGLGDDAIDRDWWMTAMKAKGKPDFEVEVYRAVPKGVKNINSGDWVTTSKKYAENHGESALSGDYEIISKKVKAKTLSTAGDPQEYGYNEEDITNLFKD